MNEEDLSNVFLEFMRPVTLQEIQDKLPSVENLEELLAGLDWVNSRPISDLLVGKE